MHTLRVLVNGSEVLATEPQPVAWLSWDLLASIFSPSYATLRVSGAVEVEPGQHDVLEWLDSHPLEAEDSVEVQVLPEAGYSRVLRRRSAAEQETFRREVILAELSGELDAARIGPCQQHRASCFLQLDVGSRPVIEVRTTAEIDTLTASGMWSTGYRQSEWRLRIATLSDRETEGASSTAFWSSTSYSAKLQLGD